MTEGRSEKWLADRRRRVTLDSVVAGCSSGRCDDYNVGSKINVAVVVVETDEAGLDGRETNGLDAVDAGLFV